MNRAELVIVVPGIRDRGIAWHTVSKELTAAGFVVSVAGWAEFFGVIPFLVPAPWFRRGAIKSLEGKIRDAIQTHTRNGLAPRVSYIAHSFGSYILCHLLRRAYHLKTNRLILCGSVLSRRFKFSGFEERFNGPVLNDVGCKDRWPLLASSLTFGYGSIGTFGYFGAPVEDRFHSEAGHGHFSQSGFCTKYWVPYLRSTGSEGIVTSDDPVEEAGVTRSLTRSIQHAKWVILAAVAYSAVSLSSSAYCSPKLVPVDTLTWASDRLAWLRNAVSREVARLEEQSSDICRYLPAAWPKPVTLTEYKSAELEKVAACARRSDLQVSRASAIDALEALQSAFPDCLEVSINPARTTVSLGVKRNSRTQRTVDLGSKEGVWTLCGCSDTEEMLLRTQRLGQGK